MADSDVATQEKASPKASTKAPSMDEIVAQQRQRLEAARKAMQEAGKDPDNRETLSRGKGHDGGACLRF